MSVSRDTHKYPPQVYSLCADQGKYAYREGVHDLGRLPLLVVCHEARDADHAHQHQRDPSTIIETHEHDHESTDLSATIGLP
jgi:hypothetical protein